MINLQVVSSNTVHPAHLLTPDHQIRKYCYRLTNAVLSMLPDQAGFTDNGLPHQDKLTAKSWIVSCQHEGVLHFQGSITTLPSFT